jgi:hypothetical protein
MNRRTIGMGFRIDQDEMVLKFIGQFAVGAATAADGVATACTTRT